MKRLGYCFLALILMLPVSALAQSVLDNGFVACQSDAQCIKIDNKCGGIAINRNSLDDVGPIAQNLECQGRHNLSPKDVPRCVNDACALVRLSDAEFRNEWPKCIKGDICEIVYDGCEDLAVNSKYASSIAEPAKCPNKAVHDLNAYGKCINNVCVIKSHNQSR